MATEKKALSGVNFLDMQAHIVSRSTLVGSRRPTSSYRSATSRMLTRP